MSRRVEDVLVSDAFSPVELQAGMITVKEDPRNGGWLEDEYIVGRVADTMSCRNPHFMARRAGGGAPRTVCFDRAAEVRSYLL